MSPLPAPAPASAPSSASALSWRVRLALTLVALACSVGAIPAAAWTPDTHREIASDALKLCPKYLSVLLKKYEGAVLEGAATGPEKPGFSFNGAQQDYQESAIPQFIEDETKRLRKLIQKPENLPEVARRMGIIAHYASLAGNPLNLHNSDKNEAYYKDLFQDYVQKQTPNFRVTFRGYDTPFKSSAEFRQLLLPYQQRTRRYYDRLGEEFYKGGKIADTRGFGPQSIPFAVASLSYSNSVSMVVSVWHSVWKSLGGDATPAEVLTATQSAGK